MAQASAGLMRYLPGPGLLTDWKEIDNKLEAFRLFQYPEQEVGDPLREGAIAMALRLPDFRGIWVLEGIGHERALHRPAAKSEILPDRTGVSVHAGLGTALAERLLAGLGSKPTPAELRATISDFSAAARQGSRPDWEFAALEPLGLVVRGLYPELLRAFPAAMDNDDEMKALFWHGAGRCSYFAPSSFIPLPGSHERLLKTGIEDAPDELARLNMMAGLVWAAILVNLPHPKVAVSFAEACEAMNLRDGFRNGLVSALMAWQHMAPLDKQLLRIYLSPEPPVKTSKQLWTSWIVEPARRAMEDIFPGLNRAGKIGHLYRYLTWSELEALAGR